MSTIIIKPNEIKVDFQNQSKGSINIDTERKTQIKRERINPKTKQIQQPTPKKKKSMKNEVNDRSNWWK